MAAAQVTQILFSEVMFVSVPARKLKDGRSSLDFQATWYPRTDFAAQTRVTSAVNTANPSTTR